MDHEIVTPDEHAHKLQNSTQLYQNTPLLAELFKRSYEDYAKRDNLDTHAFIRGIQEMVANLIQPVCQQNPHGSQSYLARLEQFNQYDQGDFRKHPDALEAIAVVMIHLVQCAIESFRALHYRGGYDRFLDLLESIFKNESIIQHNHYRTVMLMIEQLRQKP